MKNYGIEITEVETHIDINAEGGNPYFFRTKEERPHVDEKDKAEVLEAVKGCFVEWNKKDYDEDAFMKHYNKLQAYDPNYAQYIMFALPREPYQTRDWENEDYTSLL